MAESEATSRKMRQPWTFRDRWRIEGCLFTLSPLHIGTGDITTHPDLKNGDEPVEINACAKDFQRKPMISGSAIKGNLREWLRLHAVKTAEVEQLAEGVFGRDSKGEDLGAGGKAEFHDARLTIIRTGDTPLPHWREDRHTYVDVSNCIDRPTRTVAENKLFHLETVPAGVGFHVEITGFFGSEDEIKLLLAALEGFNHPDDPATLGADTASGKGRCRWELAQIHRMDKQAVSEWVKKPEREMAGDAMPELTSDAVCKLLKGAQALTSTAARDTLALKIKIKFDSVFLVNDPPTEREKDVLQEMRPPDARPRMDEMGRVILPAKSFRGALRSQAERIIRTLGGYACNPGDQDSACREVYTLAEAKTLRTAKEKKPGQLCLACRLFGAPGWKTPLAISDFTLRAGTGEPMTQEFIAIDRFTGGGKKGAKFNAHAIYQPVFVGRLELDRTRIRMTDGKPDQAPDWEIGLLALVLRDLIEGDITFGYGASKGYGTCTAQIGRIRWPDNGKLQDNARIRDGLESFRQLIRQTQTQTEGGGA